MIKALFLLIPLAAAVAMPLWMARCRQGSNRHWVLPWMGTLLPLGVVLLLHPLGLMTALSNTITLPLIAVATVSLSAFVGGALYLGVPRALIALRETRLRVVEAEPELQQRREERRDDDNGEPWSIANTQRAYMGIYDGRNGYGIYAEDD